YRRPALLMLVPNRQCRHQIDHPACGIEQHRMVVRSRQPDGWLVPGPPTVRRTEDHNPAFTEVGEECRAIMKNGSPRVGASSQARDVEVHGRPRRTAIEGRE